MTSYDPPDYDVRFRLTPEEFDGLSGTAFSVSITYDDPGKKNKGMLIIHQGGNDPDNSGEYNAWLWLEKNTELLPMTVLHAEILSPCDPMLLPEEEHNLMKYRGLRLSGEITNGRNTA